MPQATFTADFSQFTAATANAAKTVQAFQYRVDNVGPSIKRMVREFDGTHIKQQADIAVKSVERIGGATKLTESEQRKLNALVTEAIAKYKALGEVAPKELQDLANATSKASGELKTAGQSTSVMAQGLKMLGPTLAATFSIGAVTRFIGSIIEAGGELADLSKRVGISAESLQRLKAVGAESGVELETIARAATMMSRRLAGGDDSAAAAIKELGLSVGNLRAMKPDAAFLTIGSALAGIQDPMERTALGFKIFGRQWDEVSQMVTTDMREVAEGADAMSDATVKRLDEMGDAYERWKNRALVAIGEVLAGDSLLERIQKSRRELNEGLVGPEVARPDLGGGGVNIGLPSEDELEQIILKLEQGNKAWNKHRGEVEKAAEAYNKWADGILKLDKAFDAAQLEQRFLTLNASGKLSADATRAILAEYEKLRPVLTDLPPVLEQIRTEYQDVLPSARLLTGWLTTFHGYMAEHERDLARGAVAVQQYGVRLEYLTSRQLVPFLVSMHAIPGVVRSATTATDAAMRTLGERLTEHFKNIPAKLKESLSKALSAIPQTIIDGIVNSASGEQIAVALATLIGSAIGAAVADCLRSGGR